ncbi:hypothetical protein [Chryseobacterium sp. W4I1]|uniref:hypothetical protein n=1 Tax=Chryseobacterium sp. W4I1 TaxID=3042293 RepID=UPI0027807854|nr:hypothetical protein [Chryseobacterium sp. W4I1]MDQ0780930.1 hypothetical protein [Chryseobacterium sp. W4I1]
MRKKLILFWTLLIVSFIMQSCKNYYYLQHTPAVNNEDGNSVHNLKFANESLQFITFSDYRTNKVNEKYVFFKTKDVTHILKANIKKPYSEQFLFMYTNMSIYNNMLGFYYEGISLDEVMKDYNKKPDIDLGNGIVYSYNSGKFNVVDIYRKSEHGVVRFININNPDEKDPQNKKFHLEIKNLFFDLNKNLWDKNASDFQ